LVPDDLEAIQVAVRSFIAQGCELVLTTGGTGIGPRDVTPEAVRGMMRVELPGFGEAMRMVSFASLPNAILSRSLAAVVDDALVITLPGKPSGAVECLRIVAAAVPHITSFLNRDGMIEEAPHDDTPPPDLTREPMELPASRATRLQAIARGDEGFILSMAYSTQRGYGRTHAFVGELRIGMVDVEMEVPELGFAICIGEIELTECETVNQFKGSRTEPPQFTRGYGLTFGQNERKSIAMSLVDRALRWKELGEDYTGAPAQDEEFVLMHADNVQATGFLEHIKLPHYVDFQSELELVRKLRAEVAASAMQEAAE
jgi:alpha-D-ribose 1-methylphosphonate 5-triphosphate synthase subunit PhnI